MERLYIPTDNRKTKLLALLDEASRHARSAHARQLAILGLYPGQDRVLLLLDQNGPMKSGEIAQLTNVRPPTATKTIVRLEELGLVKREVDRADKRQVVVSLTETGNAKIAEIETAASMAAAAIFEQLKKKEITLLENALERLNAHLLGEPMPPRIKSSKK